MAKTPLFAELRRVVADVLGAVSGTGVPSVAALRQRAWSRRSFVHTGTAGLAAVGMASLPGCAAGRNGKPELPAGFRVAVVGGGLAGLHCALRLHEAGVDVVVLESSSRFGGRTFTARSINTAGQHCELGGELIDTEHTTMHLLAKEFGLVLDDRVIPLAKPGDLYLVGGAIVPSEIVGAQFKIVAPTMLQALTQAENQDAVFDTLDAMTLRAWLDTNVGRTQHPELYAVLETAYRGEYGLEIDEQSALNLIYLIGSDDATSLRLFGTSDERFHCHTGNDSFAHEIAKSLAGQILLEHRVKGATLLPGDRIQLQIETPHSLFVDTYDRVVFAAPFTRMRQMDLSRLGLPAEKVRVINELGYGTNTKIMGSFTERVWQTQAHAEGAIVSDAQFQQTWDTSRGQSGDFGVLTNYLGGKQGLDVVGVDPELWFSGTVVAQASLAFPGLQSAYVPGSALRMHWPSHPHTLGSYACYRPGQWASAGVEGARHGPVHFCGEHTSLDFQGFMEGAAESGAFVAFEVLEDFDLPPSAGLEAILRAKGKL